MDNDVTTVLAAIESGHAGAADRLLPIVYDALRRLASHRLAEEPSGQTLQATELVHEAYVQLIGPRSARPPSFDGRGHFFVAAAESMRRILVDRARSRGAIKRGGDRQRLQLDPDRLLADATPPGELLDLHEALAELEAKDPVKAKLVTLRFFAGLTLKDAAAALGLPSTTADRHWAYARAWLYRAMDPNT